MNKTQFLSKAMAYCSRSEKCVYDVKQKLLQWDTPLDFYDFIIDKLIDDKFVDEERFSNAFINDKVKFNHWGKQKVKYELRKRQINDSIIEQALHNISDDEYLSIVKGLISNKIRQLPQNAKMRNKLFRYMVSKGFEYEIVNDCCISMEIRFPF